MNGVHTVEENTTLVGVTELRSRMKDVLKAMKHSKVILEMRNKPFAVLLSLDRYRKVEELLEVLEDRVLGYLARRRDRVKEETYLSLDAVERKLGIR